MVLDNLSVHRHRDVRPVIERTGCHLVYPPAYSPGFNPFDLAFTTRKTHSRAVGVCAAGPRLDAGLDRITCQDIAGYDRHCGFALPDTTQPS